MSSSQLIFSLGSGVALLAAGSALAAGGVADWGLFWVGALISALALTSCIRESGFALPARIPRVRRAVHGGND